MFRLNYNPHITTEENPYKGLTVSQIELFYLLKKFYKHYEYEGFFGRVDKGMELTNEILANNSTPKSSVYVVSRAITALKNKGLIGVKYEPNKKGTRRFIYIKEIAHVQ